jgi:hypothetical protein
MPAFTACSMHARVQRLYYKSGFCGPAVSLSSGLQHGRCKSGHHIQSRCKCSQQNWSVSFACMRCRISLAESVAQLVWVVLPV